MTLRPIALVTIAVLLSLVLALPAAAAGGRDGGTPITASVSGTVTDPVEGPGEFNGTYRIERFASQDGALVALGTVDGTVTYESGGTRSIWGQPVTLPVTSISVSGTRAAAQSDGPITTQQAPQECQLLHLEFGGITLNVLGLEITLSPIALDITLSGILGGILCGLLGALAGGAPAQAQANMLNQALDLRP